MSFIKITNQVLFENIYGSRQKDMIEKFFNDMNENPIELIEQENLNFLFSVI